MLCSHVTFQIGDFADIDGAFTHKSCSYKGQNKFQQMVYLCAVFRVQCALFSLVCGMWCVQCAGCSLQCAFFSVQNIVYNIQ